MTIATHMVIELSGSRKLTSSESERINDLDIEEYKLEIANSIKDVFDKTFTDIDQIIVKPKIFILEK